MCGVQAHSPPAAEWRPLSQLPSSRQHRELLPLAHDLSSLHVGRICRVRSRPPEEVSREGPCGASARCCRLRTACLPPLEPHLALQPNRAFLGGARHQFCCDCSMRHHAHTCHLSHAVQASARHTCEEAFV